MRENKFITVGLVKLETMLLSSHVSASAAFAKCRPNPVNKQGLGRIYGFPTGGPTFCWTGGPNIVKVGP